MKILIIILIFCFIGLKTTGQTATFDQIAKKEVRGNISEYITKNGVVFRIGDTLRVGYPFRNQTFVHILKTSDVAMSGIAGTQPTPLTSTISGQLAVIKKMKGYQRKLFVETFGVGESVALSINNFEEAFTTGEIILPNYLTSEEALRQLKNEKDKLDLGLITKEEYNNKKDELGKYIK
jgi:hypothetical protein